MPNVRTSKSHPLHIAEVAAPGGGLIGVTFCPGKYQYAAMTGIWARDLTLDIAAARTWGAEAVVTLVTIEELETLRVEQMGEVVAIHGMLWLHLPIEDVSTPTPVWESTWAEARASVHQILDGGGRVLVHCKGGLGRAGTVAALILVERGVEPAVAIAAVRASRPGAIETGAQKAFVAAYRRPWMAVGIGTAQ